MLEEWTDERIKANPIYSIRVVGEVLFVWVVQAFIRLVFSRMLKRKVSKGYELIY